MTEENNETNGQELIVENNGSMTLEEQAAIKAQLEEEKQARAQVDADLTSKNERIAVLETDVSTRDAELLAVKEEVAKSGAVIIELQEQSKVALAKYRDAIVQANPNIPQALISGDSFQALFDSVEKGKTVVEAVSEKLKAAAAAGSVPAGAPVRDEIVLNGLSAREKISAGIKPK